MAEQAHLEILAKGAQQWNAWRSDSGAVPDLSGADLSGMDLSDYNFDSAILNDVKAVRTGFQRCSFRAAIAERLLADAADFTESLIEGAIFNDARLNGVQFHVTVNDTEFLRVQAHGINAAGAVIEFSKLNGLEAPDSVWTSAILRHNSANNSDMRNSNYGATQMKRQSWQGSDFSGADLKAVSAIQCRFDQCLFNGAQIYGFAHYDCKFAGAQQYGLDISDSRESPLFIDGIAQADFLRLFLSAPELRHQFRIERALLVPVIGYWSLDREGIAGVIGAGVREQGYCAARINVAMGLPAERILRPLLKLSAFVILDLSKQSEHDEALWQLLAEEGAKVQPLCDVAAMNTAKLHVAEALNDMAQPHTYRSADDLEETLVQDVLFPLTNRTPVSA